MNTEDLKLKQDLEDIRYAYKRAKRLLKNIEVFSIEEFTKKFIEWKEQLNNPQSWVDAFFSGLDVSKEKILSIQNNSEQIINKIRENLDSVNKNLLEMNDSYASFRELKWKIEQVSWNINNLLENAKKLKDDIERIKSQSESTLDDIVKLFDSAQQQISNMQEAYQKFIWIRDKIEDPNSWLKAIFDKAETTYKNSLKLYNEIQQYRDDSKQILEEIKVIKLGTDKVKNEIQKNKEDSDEKLEQIKKITSLITDTGFANFFHVQVRKIFWERVLWWIIILASVITLTTILFLYVYTEDIVNLTTVDIVYRVTLTWPLLFLLFFSVRNFSNAWSNYEKYSFKAITASSLTHHIEFFKKEFPKHSDNIFDFAIDKFNKIYKEPFSYKKKKSYNKDFQLIKNELKKQNISNIQNIDVEMLKSLKELLPDINSFNKVLDIIKIIIWWKQ